MADIPRVLLENYLMLAAAVENQNLGRMHDMLKYQQKVHQNLLDVVQHIEDAPAVAMTTTAREPEPQQQVPQPQLQQSSIAQPERNADQEAAYTDMHMQQQDMPEQQQHVQPAQQVPYAQQQQLQSDSAQLQQLQDQQAYNVQQQQQQHYNLQPPQPLSFQVQQQPQQMYPAPMQQQQPAPQWMPLQQQQQQVALGAPAWLSNVNQPAAQLLQNLGLQEYESLLQQQAVDMAALQLMEERHLRELGLPIGAVVKIKAALAAMK